MNTEKKNKSGDIYGLLFNYGRLMREHMNVKFFIDEVKRMISPVGTLTIEYKNAKRAYLEFGTVDDYELTIILDALQKVINKWKIKRKEIEQDLSFIDFSDQDYYE